LIKKLHPVVGLAAPQVGYPLRIIGYQILDKQLIEENNLKEPIQPTFLINPEMKILDGNSEKWKPEYEFCISVPTYSGLVKRAGHVQIKGYDLEGKVIEQEFKGFLARVIQHEIDHLDGMTFVDRMEPKSFRHGKVYIDNLVCRQI
jgi:peptide deformylase